MPDPTASSSPEDHPQSSVNEPYSACSTPDNDSIRGSNLDLESLTTVDYSAQLLKLDRSIRGWINQLKEITAGCIPEMHELRRILEDRAPEGRFSPNDNSTIERHTPLPSSTSGWLQQLEAHFNRFLRFCKGTLQKFQEILHNWKVALHLSPSFVNNMANQSTESASRPSSARPPKRQSFPLRELITNQRELLLQELIPRGIAAELVLEGMNLLSEKQSAHLSKTSASRSSKVKLTQEEQQQLDKNERAAEQRFGKWVNSVSRIVRTHDISFPGPPEKERIASQAQSHRSDPKQRELTRALAAVLNHREPEQQLAGQIAQVLERAALRLPPITQSFYDDSTAIAGLAEQEATSQSAEGVTTEEIPGWMLQVRQNIANRMFFITVEGDAKRAGAIHNLSHLTMTERHQLALEICHELIGAQAIGASPLERSALVLSLLHICCDQELAVVDVESFARLVINTRVPLCIDPPDARAFHEIRTASLREVVSRNTTDAYQQTLNQQHRFIENYCEPVRSLVNGEKMTFVKVDAPTLLISWDGVGSTKAQSDIGDHIFRDLLSTEPTAQRYNEIVNELFGIINARVRDIDKEITRLEQTATASQQDRQLRTRFLEELITERSAYGTFLQEDHSNTLTSLERMDKLLLALPGRTKGSLSELDRAAKQLSALIEATRSEAQEEAIRVIYSITIYPLSKMLARFERSFPDYRDNFACYIVTEGDSVLAMIGGPNENTGEFIEKIKEGVRGALDEANAILRELGRSYPVMPLRLECQLSSNEAGGVGLIVGPDNLNSIVALSGPLTAQLAKQKYSRSIHNFQSDLPSPKEREPTTVPLTEAFAPFLRNIQFDRFNLPRGHSSIPVVIKNYGLVSLELHQEFAGYFRRSTKLPPPLLDPRVDRTQLSQYRLNIDNLACYVDFLRDGFRELRADTERFEKVRRMVLEAELTGRYRLVQRILSRNEGIVVTQIYPGSILAMCVNKQADLRAVSNPEEFAALQHLQQADFLHFDLNLGANRQVLAAGVYTNPELTDAAKFGEITTPLLVISRRTEDGDFIPIQYTPGTPGYPYWAAEFLKSLGRVEEARRSTADELNRFIDQVVIAALLSSSSPQSQTAEPAIQSQIADMLLISWNKLKNERRIAHEATFSRAITELLAPSITGRPQTSDDEKSP